MTAPENLSIDTPEQIDLEFPLAGVGSRFLAIAFDTLLQAIAAAALVVALVIARLAIMPVVSAGPWIMAVFIIFWFVLYTAYFALFEVVWGGQTPGKRLVGLRVIDVSGRPASAYSAILRNVIRIVDQLPGVYGVGIVSVLVTRRQQRLGDLAAGTVVVHERAERFDAPKTQTVATQYGGHKLTAAEVLVIESFLRRRSELDSMVRLDAARRIVRQMAARLQIDAPEDEERFLERLAAEYRSGGRQG